MNVTTIRIRTLAAAVMLGASLATVPALAGDRLSERSIRGNWGFSALGTIVPPATPAPTPAAAIGTIYFDGRGRCFFDDTVNIGGTSVSRSSTACDYSVNSNGSGTISVTFPGDPGPTPLAIVVVDGAREIRFIRTDLGIAEGVIKRIRGGDDD